MGLGKNSNTIWLQPKGGKLWVRAEKGDPDAKVFERDDGTVRYMKPYDRVTGFLIDVDITESKFGDEQVVFTLLDDEDQQTTFKLAALLRGRNGKGLVAQLLNADLSQPVSIVATPREFNGKMFTNLLAVQGGKALKWHIVSTKHPAANTLPKERIFPDAMPVTINGRQTLDYTDQIAFLKGWIAKLKTMTAGAVIDTPEEVVDPDPVDFDFADIPQSPAADTTNKGSNPADDLDDLPF